MAVTEAQYKEAWRRMGRCDAAMEAQEAELDVKSAMAEKAMDAADAAVKDRGLTGAAAGSFRDGFLGVSIKLSNPRKTGSEAEYRAGKAARAAHNPA